MSNFIEKCLSGEAITQEISDYVDAWHKSDSKKELHDYLGMSEAEYDLWATNPNAIGFIIKARREQQHVNEDTLQEWYALPMAARSRGMTPEIIDWLKSRGYTE